MSCYLVNPRNHIPKQNTYRFFPYSSGVSEDSTDPEDCDLQGARSNSLKYLAKCKNIRIIFQQFHPADVINMVKKSQTFCKIWRVITDQV